jgi:hypothetical protein
VASHHVMYMYIDLPNLLDGCPTSGPGLPEFARILLNPACLYSTQLYRGWPSLRFAWRDHAMLQIN